jgi:hypothetical protein
LALKELGVTWHCHTPASEILSEQSPVSGVEDHSYFCG